MSLGRRQVSVQDERSWIFNRMVDAYGARPPYPHALIEALAAAVPPSARVADLGAGLGYVALPLAARGLSVVAVEPAELMLRRLTAEAARLDVPLRALHAKAEDLPLPTASTDLVVIADALHFMDAELVAREVDRILAPGGVVAILTCREDDTPFMRSVREIIDCTAARRPRSVDAALKQLLRVSRVRVESEQTFRDATPVSQARLEDILRSISFVGPAMNAARFADLRERLLALAAERVWARRFDLCIARASLRRRARRPTSHEPRIRQ